ncbi:MAG: thiamine diphosphokinase [Candidatus Riflebacteria bacterium]|nr:thiamine diphosphokinase [Candidatus Riflebacteria bacterium]
MTPIKGFSKNPQEFDKSIPRILLALGGMETCFDPGARFDFIIAADSGANFLYERNIPANLVVGDFDSVSLEAQAFHEDKGARFEKFPIDKNETDFELALYHLPRNPCQEITLTGIWGGRIDHSIMNLLVLSRFSDRGKFFFTLETGKAGVLFSGELEIPVKVGAKCALISLAQASKGIFSSGVQWPLKNETLILGESRGISNIITASVWKLSLEKGALLWLVLTD